MNRYGQSITWGAINAPHLFSGSCTSYSARDALTRQLIEDEAGDNLALVLHSRKVEISFEAMITAASTDFLNLLNGAAITVSGIESGVVLATRAVEKWALGQTKTASIQATHYPDMTQASPAAADANLDAVTPDQGELSIVLPGQAIVYGTYGLGHASGVIHSLTLEQQLTITEDDPSPDGKILGAASHGYMRTISLEILATGAIPNVGTVLALTGAPAHAGGYRIERAETKYALKRGKMYGVDAVWIPAFD